MGLRAWPTGILVPLLVMGLAYGAVWAAGVAEFAMPDPLVVTAVGLGVPAWLLAPVAMVIVPLTEQDKNVQPLIHPSLSSGSRPNVAEKRSSAMRCV